MSIKGESLAEGLRILASKIESGELEAVSLIYSTDRNPTSISEQSVTFEFVDTYEIKVRYSLEVK